MKLKSWNRKKGFYQINLVLCLIIFLVISGCNSRETTQILNGKEMRAEVEEILKIGVEAQGAEYQFGDPIGVRTDKSHNIYVADRASLTIRMYDQEGRFVRDIGRRGSGPSEFYDINTFEITADEHFFVLDRGNWRYKYLTQQGIEVSSIPIDRLGMIWFFNPDAMDHYEDNIIALFVDGAHNPEKPVIDRELFYVYSRIPSYFCYFRQQSTI